MPDWLRKAVGLEPRFRKGHSMRVPFAVEAALNDTLERLVGGPGRNLQTAGHIKPAILLETARGLQRTWKEAHDKFCKETGEEPLHFRTEDVDRKWLTRFLENWCWTLQASNTRGAFLADDSDIMNEPLVVSSMFSSI